MSNDTPTSAAAARDWGKTLYLPKTDFPMKAGLPQLEPKLLARWEKLDLYSKLRTAAKGKARFTLHDGPPYANGNIHIGHALNKILKDLVTRSQQMLGFDSNYIPGWDCHGLPIEWKIEEDYIAKGKPKPKSERSGGAEGVPRRMPRVRRALAFGAARRVQAPGRRRRLEEPLFDDDLSPPKRRSPAN